MLGLTASAALRLSGATIANQFINRVLTPFLAHVIDHGSFLATPKDLIGLSVRGLNAFGLGKGKSRAWGKRGSLGRYEGTGKRGSVTGAI